MAFYSQIERLTAGLIGIKRSSGMHPDKVFILPRRENINLFTPVQHPSDHTNTDIITTHFDYHSIVNIPRSIDRDLFKVDILEYDDPLMLKMMHDLTGVKFI